MATTPASPDRSVHSKGLILAICGTVLLTLSRDHASPFAIYAALAAQIGFGRCAAYWRRLAPKMGLPSFLGCFFTSFSFWFGVLIRFGFSPDPSAPMLLGMITTIVWIATFTVVDQPQT